MGIATGLSALKTGTDLLRVLRDRLKSGEVKGEEVIGRIGEIYDYIVDSKDSLVDAKDEIHDLKEKLRVGLITVDTYRIAAVEQLRTYADIIDLPMQVVSTPREMREAVGRMDNLDLILLDTAGRSPKDEVRIQELRAFLTEADADEVHLVLSSVASARVLEQTAERFAAVGTTSLILTKLDEATGLGNILPLVRTSRLPLSYLTNGQNVPDDIEAAESARVARLILGMEG